MSPLDFSLPIIMLVVIIIVCAFCFGGKTSKPLRNLNKRKRRH